MQAAKRFSLSHSDRAQESGKAKQQTDKEERKLPSLFRFERRKEGSRFSFCLLALDSNSFREISLPIPGQLTPFSLSSFSLLSLSFCLSFSFFLFFFLSLYLSLSFFLFLSFSPLLTFLPFSPSLPRKKSELPKHPSERASNEAIPRVPLVICALSDSINGLSACLAWSCVLATKLLQCSFVPFLFFSYFSFFLLPLFFFFSSSRFFFFSLSFLSSFSMAQ